MHEHIMVDLETMSAESNAAITSIGAVIFTEEEITAKCYYTINLQSCVDAGLSLSADTIIWWLNQSQLAQKMYSYDEYAHSVPITQALELFNTWIDTSTSGKFGIWGNGATFDNVILDNAYKATNLKRPWKPWDDRCYRTFKNLHSDVKHERTGTHHNALDDAIYQAEHMIAICKQKDLHL